MAPIKFEENIKEKLEKRTLKPSVNAWDKLSERLDNQEEPKNNKPYWWLGLAASIVGILFVVSQFLNENNKIEEPEIVTNPEKVIESETINIAKENNKEHNNILKASEDVFIQNKEEKQEVFEEKKLIITEEDKQPPLVAYEAIIEPEVKPENKPELPGEKLTFEEQKIQDVIAQVEQLKSKNSIVTEADIETLLADAQKEIQLNRLFNETTGVVDANALLQDVEAELDQSFRTKVFEALKSSYNSVKTAVAQRNN
ncbi:hypothetical protein DIS18_07430 [Algibacter marinivivus]|uniref:Uncharacterized protein n=1 Tax=Algibacter marinivivus TaxID=2100723 RepID=A0A2U2X967_9FLAO|nr:hypothetical protein [Algibacter marinivivus]PWH84357.1 hypothetical protein DIS18_07430 [Algibacter marinivivus]